jgi:two-component system OmpR family sensor kinase
MTLRLRLVVALLVLLTAGLALFGAATYTFYRRDLYQHLDGQIVAAVPLVDRALDAELGIRSPGGGGPDDGGVNVPLGTYGDMRDPTGRVLGPGVVFGYPQDSQPSLPKLPDPLPYPSPHLFTVGAVKGSAQFRVIVAQTEQGGMVVVAEPTNTVTSELHRLTFIELTTAAVLLIVLSAGSWLILRRGLRPLEKMAATAGTITAGDLSQRVTPSGGPSEVGQMGLALNTMLDNIEEAFKERDATEQRLRQFLADASHELRTPLTSIQGFAELFRVGGDEAKVDLPTILRRIEEESARMRVLVEDLLLLARLDQTVPVEKAPVDLAILTSDACSDAVAMAPDRPVTLDAPEPVVVAGVESHLRQAIGNLVSNAVRHTPAGSPIEVAARIVDGEAVVTVRDHGSGLAEDELHHVFDRFWQADKARVGTGAGLGLAIVASIAHEHHGQASATNAEGDGALFTIRLPISTQDLPPAPAAEPLVVPPLGAPHATPPATPAEAPKAEVPGAMERVPRDL